MYEELSHTHTSERCSQREKQIVASYIVCGQMHVQVLIDANSGGDVSISSSYQSRENQVLDGGWLETRGGA